MLKIKNKKIMKIVSRTISVILNIKKDIEKQ
jgi:hypothetical protein